eukprot:9928299-Alexandrium_andersonii.AAC.1
MSASTDVCQVGAIAKLTQSRLDADAEVVPSWLWRRLGADLEHALGCSCPGSAQLPWKRLEADLEHGQVMLVRPLRRGPRPIRPTARSLRLLPRFCSGT